MNYILFTIGPPGAGKSTFLRNSGLEKYSISPDNIRLLFGAPTLNISGFETIPSYNDKTVWDYILKTLLPFRMNNREFTIIDATHTNSSYFSKYKKLIEEYGYRAYAIDFRGVSLETCLTNNAKRLIDEPHKYVPEDVIKRMHNDASSMTIPSYIKILKPDDVKLNIRYHIHDYSNYENIYVIGDIHGCYDELMRLPNPAQNNKDLFIYVGDYIDRGPKNAEVVKFLLNIYKLPNVVLLRGNHEVHLESWSKDVESKSIVFNNNTKVELYSANINKKDVQDLLRKMVYVSNFSYENNEYLVSHAGLPTYPDNILLLSARVFIKGVGDYKDMEAINTSFNENTTNDVFQIHGHRNIDGLPAIINSNCYNLENKVEFGGTLRALKISKNGREIIEIPNETIKISSNVPNTDIGNLFNKLVADVNIKASQQMSKPYITSFNFKKKAFFKQIWDFNTTRARGLFLNTNDFSIAARSYNKFFNIGELNKPEDDIKSLSLPVMSFIKENGFLGILGYDSVMDTLLYTTKSTINSSYVSMFRDILHSYLVSREELDAIKTFIKDNNVSLVFEVINPENDPHIMYESRNRIVLLDIIYNTINFNKFSYDELSNIAHLFRLPVKTTYLTYENHEDILNDYFYLTDRRNMTSIFEGLVLEDINLNMFKIKTNYYTYWKKRRSELIDVKKDNRIRDLSDFTKWVTSNYSLKDMEIINIPELRRIWEKQSLN